MEIRLDNAKIAIQFLKNDFLKSVKQDNLKDVVKKIKEFQTEIMFLEMKLGKENQYENVFKKNLVE